MRKPWHGLPLLVAASVTCAALRAQAEDTAITPLRDHAAHHDPSDRMTVRLILDRCVALYTFASSTVEARKHPKYSEYEAKASTFLKAAREATAEREVLLMMIVRMSSAYQRHSRAQSGTDHPLSAPLLQSDLAFCEEYSVSLDTPVKKTAIP